MQGLSRRIGNMRPNYFAVETNGHRRTPVGKSSRESASKPKIKTTQLRLERLYFRIKILADLWLWWEHDVSQSIQIRRRQLDTCVGKYNLQKKTNITEYY